MNGPTLQMVEGASFAFELLWTAESGEPVDLTGCVARFVICPAGSSRALVSCGSGDDSVVLGGPAGTIAVTVAPERTAGLYSDSWKGARYELRVEFAGGEVSSLLRGAVSMEAALTL